MTLLRLTTALAAAAALVGCVYLPLGKVPQFDIANLATGHANLQVRSEFGAGGFRTQSVMTPWSSASVQHLTLKLYRVSGGVTSAVLGADGNPVVKDIPQASLSAEVRFMGLHPNATYSVQAWAYRAGGTATDDLISDPATSSTLVAIGTDDRPTMAVIPVQLLDRLFAATATSSLDVLEGSLTNLGEAIDVPSTN